MGDGLLGWAANLTSIFWTIFVCIIFCIPTQLPVTKTNMNYASVRFSSPRACLVLTPSLVCQVITIGVIFLSG